MTEKLPRGVRRRGNSLCVYLTHPPDETHSNGYFSVRSLGNVTPKFAQDQRIIFQREIIANKYNPPAVRVEQVLFSVIATKATEHSKRHKRSWDGDAQRAKVFTAWWGTRAAASLTVEEIEKKLTENLAPDGLSWSKTTFNSLLKNPFLLQL